MRDDDLRLLTRAATEELQEAETERLKALLESSRDARRALADLRVAADTLAGARFGSFAPGFADGVMARVARPGDSAGMGHLADSLVAVFYRVAVAGVLVALGLGALNVTRASNLSGSAFDAALHIPTVTFESAYEMEARALLESFLSAGEVSPITVPAPSDGTADSSSSASTS